MAAQNIPPQQLAVSLTFRGMDSDFEKFWKHEVTVIIKKVEDVLGPIENITLEDLFRHLFSPFSECFTNPGVVNIFGLKSVHRTDSKERLVEFKRFFMTLTQLASLGWSERKVNSRAHKNKFGNVAFAMNLNEFRKCLDRADKEITARFLSRLQEVTLIRNCEFLYDPSLALGMDDDKVPIRTNLNKEKIARLGGRGTRVYPTIHHLNTLITGIELAGFVQLVEESSDQTVERMLSTLKNNVIDRPAATEATLRLKLPNLLAHDRGYNLRSHFASIFATQKSGHQLDFFIVDRKKKNGGRFSATQIEVKKEGVMTLYATKSSEFVTCAFGGNGKMVFLKTPITTSPYHEAFSAAKIGVWFADHDGPVAGPKLTRVFPGGKSPNPPLNAQEESYFSGLTVFTSGQSGDAIWHLARIGLITSTSPYNVFIALRSLAMDERFTAEDRHLIELIGFAPKPSLLQGDATFTEADLALAEGRTRSGWSKAILIEKCRLNGLRANAMMNKAQLVALLRTKLQAATSSAAQPIPPVSLESVLLSRFLKSLSLKPLGSKLEKTFQKGLRNEKRIRNELPAFLERWSPDFRIRSLFKVGLCTKISGLATSPDLIATFLQTDSDSLTLAGVEMKTYTTEQTVEECRKNVSAPFRVIDITDAESFRVAVRKKSHCTQVIHHAATLNLSAIFYVEAAYQENPRVETIVAVTLVRFRQSDLEQYVSLVQKCSLIANLNQVLARLESGDATQDDLATLKINWTHFRDLHSMSVLCRLAKVVRNLPMVPPKTTSIRPFLYQVWNFTKSHDDARSRQKAEARFRWKTQQLPALVFRMMISQAANMHKLWLLITYFRRHQSLDEERSLDTFRLKLKKMSSFHDFLLDQDSLLLTEELAQFPLMMATFSPPTPERNRILDFPEQVRAARFNNVKRILFHQQHTSDPPDSTTEASSSDSSSRNKRSSRPSDSPVETFEVSSVESFEVSSVESFEVSSVESIEISSEDPLSNAESGPSKDTPPLASSYESVEASSKAQRKAVNQTPPKLQNQITKLNNPLLELNREISSNWVLDILFAHPISKTLHNRRIKCVGCGQSKTAYRCSSCNVALHRPPEMNCFLLFHVKLFQADGALAMATPTI
jgi:hypothetical protein